MTEPEDVREQWHALTIEDKELFTQEYETWTEEKSAAYWANWNASIDREREEVGKRLRRQ